MHSEEWGDPREHRGGHRMRMRMRGGPGPGPGAWGGGPFEFGVRGGPFGPPRFGGRRPRAGSVYPALQQLEDEALIQTEAGEDRRRMYTLTEEGRAYVEEHADELKASWDAVTGSVNDTEVQLRHTIHQVMVAVSQVAQAGSAAQVQQAGKILADTRRALYRILAADDQDAEEDSRG